MASFVTPLSRVTFTDEPLPFDPLANVPREAQSWLWSRLLQAVEETVWDRAACPPLKSPDVTLPVSRPGQPPFEPEWLRDIPLRGLRRMQRLEVRLALEALEVWLLAPRKAAARRFLELMREHCNRIGQLYGEMRRRLDAPLALLFLDWELRLLRYRGSFVVAPLAFGDIATFRAAL
jgi:hypothetical protein